MFVFNVKVMYVIKRRRINIPKFNEHIVMRYILHCLIVRQQVGVGDVEEKLTRRCSASLTWRRPGKKRGRAPTENTSRHAIPRKIKRQKRRKKSEKSSELIEDVKTETSD